MSASVQGTNSTGDFPNKWCLLKAADWSLFCCHQDHKIQLTFQLTNEKNVFQPTTSQNSQVKPANLNFEEVIEKKAKWVIYFCFPLVNNIFYDKKENQKSCLEICTQIFTVTYGLTVYSTGIKIQISTLYNLP